MADVSKFNVDGTEVNVKDATARQTMQSQQQSLAALSGDMSKIKTNIVNAVKANYNADEETITLTKITL